MYGLVSNIDVWYHHGWGLVLTESENGNDHAVTTLSPGILIEVHKMLHEQIYGGPFSPNKDQKVTFWTFWSFSIFQMIVLAKTLILYEQFDLDTILKVTAAIFNMDLADLNWGTNLPQAGYQAVLGVLLFAYVGVYQHAGT